MHVRRGEAGKPQEPRWAQAAAKRRPHTRPRVKVPPLTPDLAPSGLAGMMKTPLLRPSAREPSEGSVSEARPSGLAGLGNTVVAATGSVAAGGEAGRQEGR